MSLQSGQRVRGRIRTITDLVVYVDVLAPSDAGFSEGIVDATDLSWTPVTDPADHVAVGAELDLVALRVEGTTLALGKKQLTEDPYPSANNWFPADATTSGRIVRIRETGADVEIAPGVIGALQASDVLPEMRIGDEIDVAIVRWAMERHLYLAVPRSPLADAYRAFVTTADSCRLRAPYIPLDTGTAAVKAPNERIIAAISASERAKVRWLIDCIEHASRILDLDADRALTRDFVAFGRSLIDGDYCPSGEVRTRLDQLQAGLDRAVARARASDAEPHKCCANILYVLGVIDAYLFHALRWFEQEHAANRTGSPSWFSMVMSASRYLPLWHVLDGCAASAGGGAERSWQADALAARQ